MITEVPETKTEYNSGPYKRATKSMVGQIALVDWDDIDPNRYLLLDKFDNATFMEVQVHDDDTIKWSDFGLTRISSDQIQSLEHACIVTVR